MVCQLYKKKERNSSLKGQDPYENYMVSIITDIPAGLELSTEVEMGASYKDLIGDPWWLWAGKQVFKKKFTTLNRKLITDLSEENSY